MKVEKFDYNDILELNSNTYVVSDKNIAQREYIAIEMEHDNILSLTQEKYNISERSLKKTSNTLIRMNEDFTKKSENLKQRANELINNYINLANSFIE